jgi:hypothetical protein
MFAFLKDSCTKFLRAIRYYIHTSKEIHATSVAVADVTP